MCSVDVSIQRKRAAGTRLYKLFAALAAVIWVDAKPMTNHVVSVVALAISRRFGALKDHLPHDRDENESATKAMGLFYAYM